MYAVTKPSKEQVRDYMQRLRAEHKPLTPDEARRQLGWGLIAPVDRSAKTR